MATTGSSITRLLRAAAFYRPATPTVLHPHHIFHRPLHTLTTTSPLSFLRSNLSRLSSSNIHFFSSNRRVRPRATKSKLLRNLGSTALSVYAVIFVGVCVYGGYKVVVYKFLKSLDNDKMGTMFKGSLPDLFHKGHSVVVEGIFTGTSSTTVEYCVELIFSATEVVSTTKPDQLAAAMERNNYILAQKLNAANHKQNVNRCTIPSYEISNDVGDESKFDNILDGLVLEGRVNQSRAFSLIAKKLFAFGIKVHLADFEGLPDALLKGHSVVIETSSKMTHQETKGKDDESGKSVTVKVRSTELRKSAVVLSKLDEPRHDDAASAVGCIEVDEEEN